MVIGWTGAAHRRARPACTSRSARRGPPTGAAAMHGPRAGCIGFAVSAPLVAVLTTWVAVPLLALVAGFGVLVITGTPLHRVPSRLAELSASLRGRRRMRAARTRAPRPARRPRRGRLPRRLAQQPARPSRPASTTRPYDTPLLGGPSAGPGGRRRGASRWPARRRRGGRTSEALAFGGPVSPGRRTAKGRGTAAPGWQEPSPARRRGRADEPAATAAPAAGPASGPSSSRWPAPPTPATRCRPPPCCGRAPRRRRGPGPTT